MIPNAVASTGPYAGLWSHLKSIDHALERALTRRGSRLTDLDRDRLLALMDLLQGGQPGEQDTPQVIKSLLPYSEIAEPSYGTTLDLRHRIVGIPKFQDWQKSSKKGTESKIARLAKALEDYLNRPRKDLFSQAVPAEEFEILRAVLQELLAEAEVALY